MCPVNGTLKTGKIIISASALVLAALILLLSLVGASPTLHKLIHADASSVDHNCAITLFAKGQVTSLTLAPIHTYFVSRLIECLPVEHGVESSLFDVQLAPGRAPPSC